MDSSTYQLLCLRTAPGHDTDRRATLLNCALGMAGEAGEIADTPTSDEIGDGYWYAYVMLWCLGVTEHQPEPLSPEACEQGDALRAAFRACSRACELVKKHAFHGRDLDLVRPDLLASTRRYVDALAALDPQSAAATFEQNIDKLRARYPEGFVERG